MLELINSRNVWFETKRKNQEPLRRTIAKDGKSCQETLSPTDVTNGPFVNRSGIHSLNDEYMEKILDGSFFTVSENPIRMCNTEGGIGRL